MTADTGALGYAPKVTVKPTKKYNPEQRKYEFMWTKQEYRDFSPGENLAQNFLKEAKPFKGDTVIDFGCGTGRGGLMISLLGNCKVTLLDFAFNCLDEEVKGAVEHNPEFLQFYEHDLERPCPYSSKYGYCVDVMEHIPEDKVELVLKNILKASQNVFFSISFAHDNCGELLGEELHVTQKPFDWWLQKLKKLECVVYYAQEHSTKTAGIFYVSCWNDAKDLVARGVINTSNEKMLEHVKENISKGYTQVVPHQKQNQEIMIIGGGPSLLDFKDEIIKKRQEGVKLVTTNGAYNQILEWGVKPSAQVIVDARPSNIKFLPTIIPDCKYFLASQCHPSLFEKVPKDQLLLWHAALNEEIEYELDKQYEGQWYPIPGGSTVILRTLTLFRLLGYWKMHLYGFDSCLRMVGDQYQHHAFPQEENDDKQELTVVCGGKTFRCHAWMASQAQEFIDQARMLGDEVSLAVYGDGLIAHIINYAAEGSEDPEVVILE